ncbi:MAG: hypothetical protein BRC25_01810 [Parcubacteria group bacterium SW_6_46_9]|nr:MAG: hypothetical protein BRC25_01810 [Parcubacteria group bacterium SW_6_46_9]
MSNQKIILWVSLVVGLPLFGYILSTVNADKAQNTITAIEPFTLLAYVAFSLLTLITYTIVWRVFLCSYHDDFYENPVRLFNYRMVGFALSYVTPGPRFGGEITRGSLISTTTQASQKTGTIAAAMEMFAIFVAGLIFDISVVLIGLITLPKVWLLQLGLIVLVGLAFVAFLGWYGFYFRNSGYRLIDIFSRFLQLPDTFMDTNDKEPENYLQGHGNAFGVGVLLCLLTKLFIAAQMYVLFLGLNIPITILQAFLLTATVDIAYSIPSYMGLGALEAGYSGILSILGVSGSGGGVIVAFITRIRDIIFSGYGLLALGYYTRNNH